jgi:hypothetical protein
MASRDLHNNINPKVLFPPIAAVTDNTAQVSSTIDLNGFESCELVLVTGTESDADATFTVLVEDGAASNMSDHAAVDDKYLLGTENAASFDFSGDNVCRKIGYVGSKRYLRVTVTPANNTGNLFLAGVAILGHPRNKPTANPPT